MGSELTQDHSTAAEGHPQTGPEITVKINGVDTKLHRGSWSVPDLKTALGISKRDSLEEFRNGKFEGLNDTDRVTLKGGEQFISHSGGGGSSHDLV